MATSSLDGANDTLTVACDGDQLFGGRVDDGSVDDTERTSTTVVHAQRGAVDDYGEWCVVLNSCGQRGVSGDRR